MDEQDATKLHIEVDGRIVALLSEGTYSAFSNSLREVIVNAYDADATRVDVTYDLEKFGSLSDTREYRGELVVKDDGVGMSLEDFRRYSRVAPGRNAIRATPVYDRPRVGRFGIGFLAVFPFCEFLELRSTRGQSDVLIIARFQCAQYFEERSAFRSIEDVPVNVEVVQSASHFHHHGTTLTLAGLSKAARLYLSNEPPYQPTRKGRRVKSIWDVDGSTRLRWELGQVLPIPWECHPPQMASQAAREQIFGVPPANETVREWERLLGLSRHESDPGLSVYINGRKVVKPWPWHQDSGVTRLVKPKDMKVYEVVVPDAPEEGKRIVPGVDWPNQDQMFEYRVLVLSAHGPIEPKELRGIQFRIRGVGVDRPFPFESLPSLTKLGKLIRVTIEVHLTEGFDDDITIDRTELKQTPWVRAMMRSLEDKIVDFAKDFGQHEAKVERIIKQVASGNHRNSAAETKRELSSLAAKMGYQTVDSEKALQLDHDHRQLFIPRQVAEPLVEINGRSLAVRPSSDLEGGRLTRLDLDSGVVHISPRLYSQVAKWGPSKRVETINLILLLDELLIDATQCLLQAVEEVGAEHALPQKTMVALQGAVSSEMGDTLGPAMKGRILQYITKGTLR